MTEHELIANDRVILPVTATPLNYDLRMDVDMNKFHYQGYVVIDMEIAKEITSEFVLNSVRLMIIGMPYVLLSGQKFECKNIMENQKKGQITFSFDHQFQKGQKVSLHISFENDIMENLTGFYRSSYKGAEDQLQYIAATQHEAVYARQTFPCWDEPALKATFDVTLIIDKDLTGLSNMPVKSESLLDGNRKKLVFEKSPIMSVYLLAFSVGDLAYKVGHSKSGVEIRAYVPPPLLQQVTFAASIAPKILDFFEDYFGIKYPLPKLDMLALPDMEIYAMENWGLVTFVFGGLLFEEGISSFRTKVLIVGLIAHEFAHQWFGNLVTMSWWNDLWLNEGFATWAGYLATNALFPEWHIWTDYLRNEMFRGLELDCLASSHPIEVSVPRAEDIGEIFDAISYSKGSALIQMLVAFLGQDTFKKGLHIYLSSHAYGNAETVDLWASLSLPTKLDIGAIMQGWTGHIGFPLITIQSTRNTEDQEYIIRQNRYLASKAAAENIKMELESDSFLWQVPICMKLCSKRDQLINTKEPTENKNQSERRIIVKSKSAHVSMKTPSFGEEDPCLGFKNILKANSDTVGYFRVYYQDEQHMRALYSQQWSMSREDKLGLVSDLFAFNLSGVVKGYKMIVQLATHYLKSCQSEGTHDAALMDDPSVWEETLDGLIGILSMLWETDSAISDQMRKDLAGFLEPLVNHLGWERLPADLEPDERVDVLRARALYWAGILEGTLCTDQDSRPILKEARKRFDAFRDGNLHALRPNLKNTVLSLVMFDAASSSDPERCEATFATLLEMWKKSTVQDEQDALLEALCHSTKLDHINSILRATLPQIPAASETVKNDLDKTMPQFSKFHDMLIIFSSFSKATAFPPTRRLLFEFFLSNFDIYYEKNADTSMVVITYLVNLAFRSLTCTSDEQRIRDFFLHRNTLGYSSRLDQALEQIQLSAAWIDREILRIM